MMIWQRRQGRMTHTSCYTFNCAAQNVFYFSKIRHAHNKKTYGSLSKVINLRFDNRLLKLLPKKYSRILMHPSRLNPEMSGLSVFQPVANFLTCQFHGCEVKNQLLPEGIISLQGNSETMVWLGIGRVKICCVGTGKTLSNPDMGTRQPLQCYIFRLSVTKLWWPYRVTKICIIIFVVLV